MAGLINKIGDALHIGGGNKEGEHKKEEEHKKHVDEHKSGEHKEGIADKIKDKIHGGEGKSSSDMVFKPIHAFIVILLVLSAGGQTAAVNEPELETEPVPTVWPEQFHALMLMNKSGALEIVDLWYDWVNGRNFNIIQKQLGKLTYDLEWNNGTSFYYTLDASRTCRTVHFEVGILRPNWLDGAKYLGQRHVNGFLCNVWEKVEFLWYYEDIVTKRPVQWIFYTGREAHVMTFDVGAVLEDEKWQAPVYCFHNEKKEVQ